MVKLTKRTYKTPEKGKQVIKKRSKNKKARMRNNTRNARRRTARNQTAIRIGRR